MVRRKLMTQPARIHRVIRIAPPISPVFGSIKFAIAKNAHSAGIDFKLHQANEGAADGRSDTAAEKGRLFRKIDSIDTGFRYAEDTGNRGRST